MKKIISNPFVLVEILNSQENIRGARVYELRNSDKPEAKNKLNELIAGNKQRADEYKRRNR